LSAVLTRLFDEKERSIELLMNGQKEAAAWANLKKRRKVMRS